jgi:hypothetical protein
MQFRLMDPVWSFLGRSLIKPVLFLVLGISMLYQGYRLIAPAGDDIGFMRRNLAERVSEKVTSGLPRREGVPSLAVLDLVGDEQGYVTRLLREKIAASGGYRVLEEAFLRKLLREFGGQSLSVTRLEDAVAAARRIGVDLILFGDIPEYGVKETTGSLKLELRMAERATGQAIFAQTFAEEIGGSLVLSSYWRARIADSSKGRRIFIWIVFTLLLPLVTIPLIRRLTFEESNLVNLAMLAGYTVVDMLLALLLTGFWIPTIWTAGILILALATSGYYNYHVASLVERMSH